MPFNLLLLPLLAGYLFIAKTHLYGYSTSNLSKEVLILYSALAGLFYLSVSRVICWMLLQTECGFSAAGFLHKLAPFPFIGTSLGALLLAILATLLVNRVVPAKDAIRWSYHAGVFSRAHEHLLGSAYGVPPCGCSDSRPMTIVSSSIARIMDFVTQRPPQFFDFLPKGDPNQVMISLNDGKVYVGYVAEIDALRHGEFEHVRLIPTWSGYRDAERRVIMTTPYPTSALTDTTQVFVKVLPAKDISVLSYYVPGSFDTEATAHAAPRFHHAETQERKKRRPKRRGSKN